jgi:hypothetical protein
MQLKGVIAWKNDAEEKKECFVRVDDKQEAYSDA